MLEKLVSSEEQYVDDLSILVNLYYKQLKLAVASGHLPIHREQLDAIFLNWLAMNTSIVSFIAGYVHVPSHTI